MSYTTIANLITHNGFADYVLQQTTDKSALIKSGICTSDPRIVALANKGGKLVNLPFFNDLSGDDETTTEGSAATVNAVSAAQDVAVMLRRIKAWGVNDLAAEISGTDPLGSLAGRLADYWSRRWQKAFFNVLTGVFADNVANDSSDHVLDISGESATADQLINKDAILAAAELLGDEKGNLVAIACHSAVETYLSSLDTNGTNIRPSEGPAQLPTYNGRKLVIDDNCPYDAATKVAKVYIFAAGAGVFAPVNELVPQEISRDALYSRDVLISRQAAVCHVRGVAFQNATVTGATPTNEELALAANWSRVYEPKAVRVVELIGKVA